MTDVSICLFRSPIDVGFLLSQSTELASCREKPYQGHSRHYSWMPRHLESRIHNTLSVTRRVRLLTAHDSRHILEKTVDHLENLECGRQSLLQGESVKPL